MKRNDWIFPKDYKPLLSVHETQRAIRKIKEFFQANLGHDLRLHRVSAPLFVQAGSGINDDLTGTEKPISFQIKNLDNREAEIVQSLAKWKRMALASYGYEPGEGLYTDMNAIRPDEVLDNLHSIYVDQWDWERIITPQDRNLDFLKSFVTKLYTVIRETELYLTGEYEDIEPVLPEDITFVHSEELADMYGDLTPYEREQAICKKHKAVFVIGIGHNLGEEAPHDLRAPDYDDWSTETAPGVYGLNGDILIWNPLIGRAFELSSMGIRVSGDVLKHQLAMAGAEDRMELDFHKKLLNGDLPLTIGGGIGQSRLCMYYLRKAHIGEIQASLWPAEMKELCRSNNIFLL